MKVALTVWNGRISPVFDVCRNVLVLEIDKGSIISKACESIETVVPIQKVERLAKFGVDTVICGAITEPLRLELISCGLNIIGFVAGEVEEVLHAFLAGKLPDQALSMPGCRISRKEKLAAPEDTTTTKRIERALEG